LRGRVSVEEAEGGASIDDVLVGCASNHAASCVAVASITTRRKGKPIKSYDVRLELREMQCMHYLDFWDLQRGTCELSCSRWDTTECHDPFSSIRASVVTVQRYAEYCIDKAGCEHGGEDIFR
jgi:hypothetical protein